MGSSLAPPPGGFVLLVVPGRCFCCGPVCFVFWGQISVLFRPFARFCVFI